MHKYEFCYSIPVTKVIDLKELCEKVMQDLESDILKNPDLVYDFFVDNIEHYLELYGDYEVPECAFESLADVFYTYLRENYYE